jgi:hypothetical protein
MTKIIASLALAASIVAGIGSAQAGPADGQTSKTSSFFAERALNGN